MGSLVQNFPCFLLFLTVSPLEVISFGSPGCWALCALQGHSPAVTPSSSLGGTFHSCSGSSSTGCGEEPSEYSCCITFLWLLRSVWRSTVSAEVAGVGLGSDPALTLTVTLGSHLASSSPRFLVCKVGTGLLVS